MAVDTELTNERVFEVKNTKTIEKISTWFAMNIKKSSSILGDIITWLNITYSVL